MKKVWEDGFSQGYAAAIIEMENLAADAKSATPKASPAGISVSAKTAAPLARTSSSPPPNGDYVPRLPRGRTRRLVQDFLEGIAPKAAGATEIQHGVRKASGVSVPGTSIRRCLEALREEGAIEEVDDTRTWRIA
ncbi:MAG: hypothetical protein EXQ95_03560 [Alphaproteobacteria bacterium]|nr:hypothetical protein [Alphaproteobacteria bacterium]